MKLNRTTALILLISLMVMMLVKTVTAQEATPEATPDVAEDTAQQDDMATYTVVAGDTLYRIALHFGTTVEAIAVENGLSTGLIFVDQELRIPAAEQEPTDDNETQDEPEATEEPMVTEEPVPTELPEPTAIPDNARTYRVMRGDTLFHIGLWHDVTVDAIAAANNITDTNSIEVGRVLVIPDAGSTPRFAVDTDDMSMDDPGFDYGIIVFTAGQAPNLVAQQSTQLGANWIKVYASWRDMEAVQGQINYTDLDSVINALSTGEHKILLTVTNSPTWARSHPDENGPPDDLANYTNFVEQLATQYVGRVAAYQIWDEPNIRLNWNCDRSLCDTSYFDMISQAYAVIKAADQDALVVTAGLAPTRFNDRVNAISDLLFLDTLYYEGVASVSDAIAVHPGGAANPPDAECCDPTPGIETHHDNDSFFFKSNLEDYRAIMVSYDDHETPLWVTKFGWGSNEGITIASTDMNVFVTYTSAAEQATYATRAFEIGQELGYIGPMFLNNLNGCQVTTGMAVDCFASLVAQNGTFRPIFTSVQNIDKSSVEAAEEPAAPSPANNNISTATPVPTTTP
jgi:LysM repeat protein